MGPLGFDPLDSMPGLAEAARVRPSAALAAVPSRVIQPGDEGPTPANAGDTKSFVTPKTVPATVDTSILPGTDVNQMEMRRIEGPRSFPGPITPELAIGSGFPREIAADVANLGNFITGGESARDDSAYNELWGGGHWAGSNSNHPRALGWQGYTDPKTNVYSDVAGVFQDKYSTWVNDIVPKYLGGDARFTHENQIKGNILLAIDVYKQKTNGRDLLADFKAGQYESIRNALGSTWTSLKGEYGTTGAGTDADRAFNEMRGVTRAGIEEDRRLMHEYIDMANREPPGSAEMVAHLRRAMKIQEEMGQKYLKLAEKPPVAQTPMEAASGITPVLIGLAMLGGFATRRPALGAINALSGALQGLKEGNDDQYRNNIDLWKTQTDFSYKAFQMQNATISNIIEDINLTERQKQEALTTKFREWEMTRDLNAALRNDWKEVYTRATEAPLRELEYRTRIAQANKALEEDTRRKEYDRMGAADVPQSELSTYIDLWKAKLEELHKAGQDRDPNQQEIAEMHRKAHDMVHTKRGAELSVVQRQKNADIKAAQDRLHWASFPATFDQDVAQAVLSRRTLTPQQLKDKGYDDIQAALYKSKVDLGLNPTRMPGAENPLIKDYDTARRTPYTVPEYNVSDTGAVSPLDDRAEQAVLRQRLEQAVGATRAAEGEQGRAKAKTQFLQFSLTNGLGLKEQDFDALWPPPVQTPTGPVLTDPVYPTPTPNEPLGMQPQYFQ